MTNTFEMVEKTMAAVAFTDVAEYVTAMEAAGIAWEFKNGSFLKKLEQNLISATFAEAGCFECVSSINYFDEA